MGTKVNILLISIEFLLVGYIVLGMYAAMFADIMSPEDSYVGLNATNEDPKIIGIGKFAVDEYNRMTKNSLKFQNVVRAVIAVSSYVLIIEVVDGTRSESKQYGAIVKEQGPQRSLTVFEELLGFAF